VLGDAKSPTDLGADFGATITTQELNWAIAHEWVRTGEDFLWRRTKLGLRLDDAQRAAVNDYVVAKITLAIV
jgi:glycerol-3-phosphate dehydrogenase